MKILKAGILVVFFKFLALPAQAAVQDFNSLIEATSVEEVETQIRILEGQPERTEARKRAQQKIQDLMLTGADDKAIVVSSGAEAMEITLATGK